MKPDKFDKKRYPENVAAVFPLSTESMELFGVQAQGSRLGLVDFWEIQ